jgi:succinate-acetate transporter protein
MRSQAVVLALRALTVVLVAWSIYAFATGVLVNRAGGWVGALAAVVLTLALAVAAYRASKRRSAR